ncbi:MAG TPA: hypothetical protein VJ805_10850 [Nitrospiraceae bacterium]|nr:hypothetical protein [Nitrospiraceae bacterium]
MRKPGEPIYLRIHMVALALAVAAPLALPRLYEIVIGPLSFVARVVAGILIAAGAGVMLYRLYGPSARNEPGP